MPQSNLEADSPKTKQYEKTGALPADIATIIHFDGILHRFHRTELKPINFGMEQDVTMLLGCFGGSFAFYHLITMLIGVILYKTNLTDLMDAYLNDKVLMTGLLLTCWFVGYNLVSYAIWSQFESMLERDAPPDDFEFVSASDDPAGSNRGEGMSPSMDEMTECTGLSSKATLSRMASQTLLVTMPSGELVIGANTRSQSHDSLVIMQGDSHNKIKK